MLPLTQFLISIYCSFFIIVIVSSMPELPEVEWMRAKMETMCIQRKITDCILIEQGGGPRSGLLDDKVISCPPESLRTALVGNSVKSTGRRGKHMYLVLSNQICVLFHLGMTGSFVFHGQNLPQCRPFKTSEVWPPRFCKLEFAFEDSSRIAFCDPRRLGKVRMCKLDELFVVPPLSKLALDPIHDRIDHDQMFEIFQKTSSPIKALILDQERAFSGVGNWIADEVIYQTGLHPSKAANKLTFKEVKALSDKINEVCRIAIECNGRDEEYPLHWLFHQRWRGKKSGGKMPDGSSIHFETVGGRTSAIVTPISKNKKKSRGDVEMTADKALKEVEVTEPVTSNKRRRKRAEARAAEKTED